MYSITGFTGAQIDMILKEILTQYPRPETVTGRPRIFSERQKLVIALTYLRKNRTQQEMAEENEVSQPLISEIVNDQTAKIAAVFGAEIPTLTDLTLRSAKEPLIADGTFVNSAKHAYNAELYSGKHHRNGHNLQIISTLNGELLYVSEPLPGKMHDAKAILESGILNTLDITNTLADKGYAGLGLITPIKRKPYAGINKTDQQFNTTINSMRSAIERCIAHFKRALPESQCIDQLSQVAAVEQ